MTDGRVDQGFKLRYIKHHRKPIRSSVQQEYLRPGFRCCGPEHQRR